MDRPADQDGCADPDRGRLLRRPRQVRRPHGNAGLLAVHGQPGTDPQGFHRDLHLHPQLPEPPRYRHPGLSGFRRTGRHVRAGRPDRDRCRVHGADQAGQCQGR